MAIGDAPKPNNPEKSSIEKIKEMREAFYKAASNTKLFEFQDKLVEYANYIKTKYPNWNNYIVFHILIGSTPPDDNPNLTKYDFPEDDSVEKFIRSFVK